MKDYLIDVKYIQSTSMIMNALNKKDALKKVDVLIKNYVESNNELSTLFDKAPIYKYKINKIKK